MKTTVLALVFGLLAGCGIPAFTSSMRANGFGPEVPLEAVCVRTGRDAEEVNGAVQQHYAQGYRLLYISEYTSDKRPGFPTNLCFERPRR